MLNLLEHTAGFDDMHFTAIYNVEDPADLPLLEVLQRNPASLHVRWQPGTRMSYSNSATRPPPTCWRKSTQQPFEE